MLDSFFNAPQNEPIIYQKWQDHGLFRNQQNAQQQPYCIMMPPPNVTGNLHIGHALTYTLQDILIRFHRMKGADILWQPGVDHAGISTQMMVERQLKAQGTSSAQIGREAFLQQAWQWKNQYGNQIVDQQKKLGILCDWSRHRFTMDEGLSHAVTKIFVKLYNEGHIYRAKRLVNWDPQLLTAVSDLEVKMVETTGTMTYMRYPLASGNGYITVATTRPETLFGDMAIAVNPKDKRYTSLIGTCAVVPFINRHIPIIADDYVDAAFESGAVKITPAHDFNDFEVGKRHNLDMSIIMDIHGNLTADLPAPFAGMNRFDARARVVVELEKLGLLDKQTVHQHSIPYGDRSEVVLEPRLTDQWFMNVDDLAAQALQAAQNGETVFIPENQLAIFKHWMTNIQPWCISRQLWWGHQIPVWYSDQGDIFCAQSYDEALQQAQAKLGQDVTLRRDQDVLDTWFSSALWPFSTLGWPDQDTDLKRYYPTAVLITGEDILFFWVARMMMMGLYATQQVPFKTVFFNPLVRDEQGQKMSKTKGNVIDPLSVIADYSADALRFSLASLTSPGRDIRFSVKYVEQYRNFMTKIWNAARFCEHNQVKLNPDFNLKNAHHPLNQWMLSQVAQVYEQLEMSLDSYRFDEATTLLYRFVRGTFCDWYIELSKPIFNGHCELAISETRHIMAYCLRAICQLIHPFMPFISESLWQHCFDGQTMLAGQSWQFDDAEAISVFKQPRLDQFFTTLQDLITAVRGARKDLNVPLTAMIPVALQTKDLDFKHQFTQMLAIVQKLARIDTVNWVDTKPLSQIVQCVVGDVTVYLELGSIIDFEVEKNRLQNTQATIQKEIDQVNAILSKPDFVAKAPPAVLTKNQDRLNLLTEQYDKVSEALKGIG